MDKHSVEWVDRETLLYDRIPRILAGTAALAVMIVGALGLLHNWDLKPIMWFFAGMVVATFYSEIAGRLRTW